VTEIKGHYNEWVALIDNKIVAASKSFGELVKKLREDNLLGKVTVTHVSGNHVIFYARL